jgi:hypothetical protein
MAAGVREREQRHERKQAAVSSQPRPNPPWLPGPGLVSRANVDGLELLRHPTPATSRQGPRAHPWLPEDRSVPPRDPTTWAPFIPWRHAHARMLSQAQLRQLMATRGQNFDLLFLEMMSAHHQDAIEMANSELRDGSRPEVKRLAQQIIDDQKAEIDQFEQWQQEWAGAGPLTARHVRRPVVAR